MNNDPNRTGRPIEVDLSSPKTENVIGHEDPKNYQGDRRKRELKREARFIISFFSILIGLSLYFAAWNIYINNVRRNNIKKPFQFHVRHREGEGSKKEIIAGIKWVAKPSDTFSKLPSIVLNDKILKESEPMPIEIKKGNIKARFIIPDDVPRGDYRGRLIFATNQSLWLKSFERENFLDEKAFNFKIKFDIMSFWEEWDLLRKWFYVVVIIWILFYLVCLKVYPSPEGILNLCYYYNHRKEKSISKLGTSIGSWLRPWRRSLVNVNKIIERQSWPGNPEIEIPEITLDFTFKNVIAVLISGDLKKCRRFNQVKRKYKMNEGSRISGSDTISENPKYWYVFWVNDQDYVEFTYSSF